MTKETKVIKGKKWLKEFKEFAIKGNVIDLAVAVSIGAAFGKIVSSLVADIVMPIVGIIIGGVEFSGIKWTLKSAVIDSHDKIITPAVTMNIGTFIQNIFDFVIIAFVIFLMVKIITRLKDQLVKEQADGEVAPPPLTKDQELLTEIKDLLSEKKIAS